MTKIIFEDLNGIKVSILRSDLEKYPNSYLSTLVIKTIGDDFHDVLTVPFLGKTLESVAYFYKNDIWKNPYIFENKLEIVNHDSSEIMNFEAVIDYLNLPYEFEDVENGPMHEYDDIGEEEEWQNEVLKEEQEMKIKEQQKKEIEKMEMLDDYMRNEYTDY